MAMTSVMGQRQTDAAVRLPLRPGSVNRLAPGAAGGRWQLVLAAAPGMR